MQDLTFRVLEKTILFSDDQREGENNWDSNKNWTIVIRDKISISMGKSYNDMHTNKKAIQRNKV